jgi:hypothetical protein
VKPSWADTYWEDIVRPGVMTRRYFFYTEFDMIKKIGVAVFPNGFRIPLY